MATEIGVAYLSIVPSLDGASRELQKQLGAAESDVARKGKFGSKIWGGLKVGAVAAGAGIAGVLTGSIAKGFQRLSAIEDAEAKLTGLGHSGEEVQKIMDSALAAVKGTSYGMGDAASLSATMVAAGIKPGEDLENTLRLVADSATIAGRDLSDMGLIWGQVASKQKLTGEDAAQIMESGIPIWQLVGKEMGVTAGEAQELASKGEVSFDIFRRAMESGLGGAALESGKTVRGAFSNMGAAMGRFGAELLEKVYPLIGPVLGKITDLFDYLTDQAGPAIDKIIEKATPFVDALKGIWSILANGDFKGGIFGLEEDHWIIGLLFTIRDAAIGLYEKAIKPLGKFIQDNLTPILAGIGGVLAYLAGSAIVGAIGSLAAAIGGVIGSIAWIPIAIGAAVGALTWFFTETETGQQILTKAWGLIKQAVAGVVDWFMTTAWPAILTGWDILKAVVAEVVPVIISYAQTLGSYWSQIVMGVIVPAIMQFVGYVRDVMFPIIQRLWTDYVQPAFTAIGAFIVWAWENAIKPALTALFTFITGTLAPTIVWLWQNVVSPAFTAIGSFIAWAWNSVIFPALDALKWFITSVLAPTVMWLWKNVITPAWAGISWAIDTAWAVIQVIFAAIKSFIDNTLAPVFTWLWKNVIVPAWDGIKSSIDKTWTWLKDNVFTPLKNFIQDKVAPGFEAGVDAIGGAWDKLKSIAMAPVRFVVDSVINKGIIDNFNKIADTFGTSKIARLPVPGMPSTSTAGGRKRVSGVKGASMAMATGGVLPGYTPGRDVHHFVSPTGGNLHLSGGEAIMRPEWTRAVGGPAAVAAMNRRARKGMAFKDGGVLGSLWGKAKNVAGDALDVLLEGWDFATEALGDPGGALKKVAQAMLKNMPGAGGFKDMVAGVPIKVASVIGEKLAGLGDALGGGPIPAGGTGGTGGTLGAAESLAKSMGLSITSRGRRGARTAGSGSVSLHALGRAIDVAAPMTAAGKRLMMSYFNAASARWSPTELLYTPAGARNIHRGGGRYPNTGATARNHYNHVHIGFAEGGVLGKPFLHDQGGWHEPGELSVNQTRRPEAVLTDSQWATMSRLAEQNLAASSATEGLDLSDASIERMADAIERRPVRIGTRQFYAGMVDSRRAMGVH